MSEQNGLLAKKPALNRSGISRLIQVVGSYLVFAIILFSLAGRLDWWGAWGFIGISLLGVAVNGAWMLRHDPGLINERGRVAENVKGWDKIIVTIYSVRLFGMVAAAGLDARFGWSSVPLALKLAGAAAYVFFLGLSFWVMAENTFLSGVVRIQEERGHHTISTGPYRYVRHPLYAGMLCMFWGMPLMLGSWWALLLGLLTGALFVIRTTLEDKTLQAELPGYTEYAQKVRYRLIPGVW